MDSERLTRRKFVLGTTSVGIAGLSGCSGDGSEDTDGDTTGDPSGTTTGTTSNGQQELADELTIHTPGGAYGRSYEEAFITPFEEEYGVTINHQTYGDNNELLAGIRAGSVQTDVVDHETATLYEGLQDDTWKPIRQENVPHVVENINAFEPGTEETPYDPGDEWNHVPLSYFGYGLAWNTEQVDAPDRWSWSDIHTEELRGQIGYPSYVSSVVSTAALQADVDFNTLDTDTESKMETVWDQVREQDEYVYEWWSSGATAEQQLSNEDILASSFWRGRVFALREEDGVPLDYTVPEEGALGDVILASMTATEDPKRYTAETFLDFLFRQEPSRKFAQTQPYAQAMEVEDAPESYLANADIEYSDLLTVWDPEVLNEYNQEWQSQYQQIVRG